EETTEIFKYEIFDDFDNVNFGCLKKAGGYAQDVEIIAEKTLPSIPTLICSTIKYGLAQSFHRQSQFKNHYTAYDDGAKLVYLRGEIQYGSLDNGTELGEYTLKHFRPYGIRGDTVAQFIPTNLGSEDSGENAFNLNSAAQITAWRNALEKCYNHLKMDESNSIRFIYVLGYPIEEFRPSAIFFHFKCFSRNGEEGGETMEGKIGNRGKRPS
uniref:Uncharacterized protein n=1 Tax=Panagrolaimus sp. ES5 TaxID=591445 RepID=A0AC34GIL9_9BILA